MHKILSTDKMRQAEQNAVTRGISLLQLMENAGSGATTALLENHANAQRGLMICGKGNNGGDALVMVRLLAKHGIQADVLFVLGGKLSDLAQINRNKLPENTLIHYSGSPLDYAKYDFFVDAVFGTGFSGSLPENIAAIFSTVNQQSAKRFALDIPSGIDCDTGLVADNTFQAHTTFAFGALKPAHTMTNAQKYCGNIQVIDIGI